MKKIINDVNRVVDDMLDGIVATSPGLARIEGYRIVVDGRVQRDRRTVAVLSGGGAGHEPAHAGYVGAGMLAGAISGDVFTSPSVDAVLEGIRAFAGGPGVLLIVKNYTGDRLNFGLAMEIARSEGIPVEMVLVKDDVAIDMANSAVGARGIAGTIFVHKIAGAAAAAGRSLAEVTELAGRAAQTVGTMGVGLSSCIVPAAGRPGFELGMDEIELGLGIHGEAGVRRVATETSRTLVSTLVDAIIAARDLKAGDRVAVLVNGLGGTPPMELAIAAGDALAVLRERGLVVDRLWSGTFLSALEMAGLSISLMRLDGDLEALLDAPSDAPAWPRATGSVADAAAAIPAPRAPRDAPPSRNDWLDAAIREIASAIIAEAQRLNELDQIVGDGDIGISLRRGAEAVLAELPHYPLADLKQTLIALSGTLRHSLGGSSGPLYAVMLIRAAEALGDPSANTTSVLSAAFAAGVDGVRTLGGARVGDRTMVDALVPASQALLRATEAGGSPRSALASAADAAAQGAATTAAMTARLGRSSYLGERALGVPDPGAEAVVVWLRALANVAAR